MKSGRESFHVWQRFTVYAIAADVANRMERMTGEACVVESRGLMVHYVLRDTGNGKMVRV